MAQNQQENDLQDFLRAPLTFWPPGNDIWYKHPNKTWQCIYRTPDEYYSVALLKHLKRILGPYLTKYIWDMYLGAYRNSKFDPVHCRTNLNIRILYSVDRRYWCELLAEQNPHIYLSSNRGYCLCCGEPSLQNYTIHKNAQKGPKPRSFLRTNKYGLAVMGICYLCNQYGFSYEPTLRCVIYPSIVTPPYKNEITPPRTTYRIRNF